MAKSFSKRWQNGEISNFQYLMHLNTLAGRGYSDLTQYPVFPWVLADYESENLDFSDPKTFRRLEKPMGCQTPEGEEEFRKRWASIIYHYDFVLIYISSVLLFKLILKNIFLFAKFFALLGILLSVAHCFGIVSSIMMCYGIVPNHFFCFISSVIENFLLPCQI